MAPPPEYDKEPKAPDKSATVVTNEDSKVSNVINDLQTNSDPKSADSAVNNEVEKLTDNLDDLDEYQLRDLLDEAILYKSPKDRRGKSRIFQGLLDEVEHLDEISEATARNFLGANRPNSLHDLIAVMKDSPSARLQLPTDVETEAEVEAETEPQLHTKVEAKAPTHSPLSSLTVQDNNIPADVDTSIVAEEPASGGYFAATVKCFNPPPLAERRVTAADASCPAEMEMLNKRSKPMFPMYTARATLKIGSGSVGSDRAVTTTTASNQVDAAIPFSSIITPEVVASCNTTSSTSQSAVAVDPKPLQLSSCYRAVASITGALPAAAATVAPSAPAAVAAPAAAANEQPRSVISSTFNGLPLSRPNYGATAAAAAADDYKKSLDENGNAVQGIGSPVSGSSQHKKPRRKKSSKNETVIKSHQIDGYQGNKDLNEVLRFIESNADGGRGAKLPRAKHKDDSDDKTGKKRSAERRKDKDAKPKRATSMEELSRTKLEDLTDAPEPPRAAPPPAKPERRSWGDGARDYFREPEPAAAELTDFQTVTKRRKPRRRTDDGEREPASAARRARPPDRSDRSNDSNDDMDSVHSLPPAAPRHAPPAAVASYADIARTRHNIPDLIESCNFYAEGEGGGIARRADRADPTPAPIDADGYPALGGSRRAAKPPPAGAGGAAGARIARDRGKERAPGGGAPAAPDVVADRRPPVILLDSSARPRDMDGVTFGFDINEQLLGGGGARRPRCDLVREAAAADASGAVAVRAGGAALRYVPPDPPADDKHLHQIVDYVGSAWEDVVRCGGGEVRYFSE